MTYTACRASNAFGFRKPGHASIQPRQAQHSLNIRLGGSSDLSVFAQIFKTEEYSCLLKHIHSPGFILDLGANVGYSSAYFLSCFPNARVMAVEPDPSNFSVCSQNLAAYGDRVQVVLGAAWSKRSQLVLSRGTFGDGREWATEVRERKSSSDDSTVEGWDIPSLMDLAGKQQIDLLKIDIEGSERDLFGANTSDWLPSVRNICIELHGEDCSKAFFGALKDYEYEVSHSDELTICTNLRSKIA